MVNSLCKLMVTGLFINITISLSNHDIFSLLLNFGLMFVACCFSDEE